MIFIKEFYDTILWIVAWKQIQCSLSRGILSLYSDIGQVFSFSSVYKALGSFPPPHIFIALSLYLLSTPNRTSCGGWPWQQFWTLWGGSATLRPPWGPLLQPSADPYLLRPHAGCPLQAGIRGSTWWIKGCSFWRNRLTVVNLCHGLGISSCKLI